MLTTVPNSMLSEYVAKPCFKATLGGTDAVVPANATTLIPFTAAAINVGNYFATSTSRFTPPTGIYRLTLRGAQATTVAAGEGVRVSFFKNGAAVSSQYFRSEAVGAILTFGLTALVTANGTDYFDARFFSFSLTGTKTITGDTTFTTFEGEQV